MSKHREDRVFTVMRVVLYTVSVLVAVLAVLSMSMTTESVTHGAAAARLTQLEGDRMRLALVGC